MIELVPWMLILVWWHPDEPGRFELRREPYLFASEDACRIAGANRVAGSEMYQLEYAGLKATYHCTTVPGSAEYDALFAEIDKARRQDNTNMQKTPDRPAGERQ